MSLLSRVRWINLGLLVLAGLALALTWWTRRLPTSGELEVRKSHLLPVFREEQLDRIEIRQGERRTVLVRAPRAPRSGSELSPQDEPEEVGGSPNREWRLVEPFDTDADSLAAEKLVGSLRYATWERQAPGPLPTTAANGAPAALLAEHVLMLQMGEISYRLRLGGDSPSPPGSRYIEVARGESAPQVYVIEESLVEQLFVDGSVFRGRQIVPYGKSSVRQMVLSSAAGVRRLTRSGEDFRFDGMHDGQRAERGAVDRIFLALARASADPFLELDVAKAALSVDTSAVRIALSPLASEKPEASLEFGGVCPSDTEKAVAIRHLPDALAGCVEVSVLLPLREPAEVLIDRGLFALNADEVDTVRIEEGESVLEFARSGDGFTLRAPRAAGLDAAAARDRLSRILNISGELLEPRDKPATAAQFSGAVVTLESHSRVGGEPARETVRVGPARADGTRLVSRDADGAVLLITAEEALALRADATLLKSTQVFDYALRDLRGIEVSHGSVKQVLARSEEGALTLVTPKGFDVDGALAAELMDELRSLEALRWVNDSASKGFGLDKPRATARLRLVIGGEPLERVLTLGRNAPGGYYASVDRDPGVFVVPRSVERVLGTWLLDRSIFQADRESISELTLTAEGRGTVQLRRVAGELTVIKASSGFDATRIEELLDAIEALRPDAAVHPGPAPAGEGLRRPILTGLIRRISPKAVGLPPIRFSVGSRDSFKDTSIYYARHASVNATYALPRNQVQALLDLF